ncbi:hypothetical protein DLAC_01761 [Tieghemostelium lacteum]|uniref:Transmembrane protein n=1 Tax=Tieghemostelium lacteum TaxID=361077 RepID=A0A152A698_TIELA|nr:hypothetical protein DLAC_01761 [Tieghemostelium lacteum]|eukprot:KYR01752.1 hypothetical protein DLAC_01761 [Tieghemostelium lacteum]
MNINSIEEVDVIEQTDLIEEPLIQLESISGRSGDLNFFTHIENSSRFLIWHLRLIGIGWGVKWISIVHALVVLAILVIHNPPWIISISTYLFLVFLASRLEHLEVVLYHLVHSDIFNNRYRSKYQKVVIVYLVLTIWCVCIGMIPFLIKYPNSTTDNKVLNVFEGLYSWLGFSIAIITRSCIFILFYIILFLHYLEKYYFQQIIETRSLLNTPYGPLEVINEEKEETPTVDSLIQLHTKLRESLNKTMVSLRLMLVVIMLALAIFFVLAVWDYFIQDDRSGALKFNIVWVIVCPLIFIILLLPILLVNNDWSELTIQVRIWIEYTMEERTFLLAYLSQQPIQFSIFGIVITKQLVASVTFTLLATAATLVLDRLETIYPSLAFLN